MRPARPSAAAGTARELLRFGSSAHRTAGATGPFLMPRTTNRFATVAGLLLALFMAAMEMTVVSTAMPTVIADLGGAGHYV